MERASYKVWIWLVSLCLFSLAGCVSLPKPSAVEPNTIEALSGHVNFLTQPALKGRFAGSWESVHVRRYLSSHLKQSGCVPWADNPSYELDFGFGKNIIAVLPGSDPELSKEIVLISAHYDHLKPNWFSYYPGACDNAASVAVLLEMAKNISRMEQRPKRTVCFAFFDSEEMMCLGSFAFTCRDDYHDSKIVSVLNMDLLGRDLLDTVDNSLIVSGAEYYPDIHRHIETACAENNLHLIPLQADLIGPGSDHVAFTSSRRPVLFFTCGIYKDYHQPSDTADKINFSKLQKEGAVVESTLVAAANQENIFTPSRFPVKTNCLGELLGKFKENSGTLKLDPNDIKVLDELIAAAAKPDPNGLSPSRRLAMERESLGKLIKLLRHYDKALADQSDMLMQFSSLFALQPEAIAETYRQTVRHYLKHKPSLFKKNAFAYQSNLPLTGNDWGIVKTGDHEFLFGAVNEEVALQNEIHLLSGFNFAFAFKHKLTACKGSLPQIIDFVFAGKDPNGLIKETYQEAYMIGFADLTWGGLSKEELTKRKETLWSEFRTALGRQFPEEVSSGSLGRYHDPGFLLPDPNSRLCDNIFISSCPEHGNKKLSIEDLIERSINMLEDSSRDIRDRVNGVSNLAHLPTRSGLTAIAEVLDNPCPYVIRPCLIDDPNFPLREHAYVSEYTAKMEKDRRELKDKTLGQIALEKLKWVTKQDFGTDKEAWKDYIRKRYK